ncbi:MAG: acetate/propionate family kinase [Chloroflexota bacterium]|nr:acetate/propionate family kinase [Chloroflexota bacterium]
MYRPTAMRGALRTVPALRLRFRAAAEESADEIHFIATDADGTMIADERWQSEAMPRVIDFAENHLGRDSLLAVGHRVVHGGSRATSERVDKALLDDLARVTPWAPLHQPQNLQAIRDVLAHRPELPQVACFDTAFHHTLGRLAAMYPIPRAMHDAGLRRYGFHGLSYEYIAGCLHALAPELSRVIVAHLGNGASLCALRGGISIDTTMGLTPLDGLMMGTRSGAIDPGLVLALLDGRDPAEVTDLLYHQSGLKGVSGIASDMRSLADSHDPAAAEAIDLFNFRIAREAGGMAASRGGVDGVVFTGGIGEHASGVREAVCARLAWLGISLDLSIRPGPRGGCISMPNSHVAVWVIPTDEETVIARHTRDLMQHA